MVTSVFWASNMFIRPDVFLQHPPHPLKNMWQCPNDVDCTKLLQHFELREGGNNKVIFENGEQYTTNRRYYVVDVVFGDSKTLKMSF